MIYNWSFLVLRVGRQPNILDNKMVNQASVLVHYAHKACETQTQSAVLISASDTVSSSYWKSCQNGLPETVARTSTLFDRVDNYRQR